MAADFVVHYLTTLLRQRAEEDREEEAAAPEATRACDAAAHEAAQLQRGGARCGVRQGQQWHLASTCDCAARRNGAPRETEEGRGGRRAAAACAAAGLGPVGQSEAKVLLEASRPRKLAWRRLRGRRRHPFPDCQRDGRDERPAERATDGRRRRCGGCPARRAAAAAGQAAAQAATGAGGRAVGCRITRQRTRAGARRAGRPREPAGGRAAAVAARRGWPRGGAGAARRGGGCAPHAPCGAVARCGAARGAAREGGGRAGPNARARR